MSLKIKQGGAFVGGGGGGGVDPQGVWSSLAEYVTGDMVWDTEFTWLAVSDPVAGVAPFEGVPEWRFPKEGAGTTALVFPYADFCTTFVAEGAVTFDKVQIYYPSAATTAAGTVGFANPITTNTVNNPTWLANGSVAVPAGAKPQGWYEVTLPAPITLVQGQSYSFVLKGCAKETGYENFTTANMPNIKSPLLTPTHTYFNTSTSSGVMNTGGTPPTNSSRFKITTDYPAMWKKMGVSPTQTARVLRQVIESNPVGGAIKSDEVTAPAWAKTAHIIIIGPGGSGGSGRRGAAATTRAGGGGGSAGGRNEAWILVDQLTDRKFSMYLRPTNEGGAAIAVDNTNGASGKPTAAGDYNWVDLGSYQGKQQRFGCGSGTGGGGGGGTGVGGVSAASPAGGLVGPGGGNNSQAGGGVPKEGHLATPSGGGGGGGVASNDTHANSGASGQLLPYANNAGPNAVATEGTAGGAGWTAVGASNVGAGGAGGGGGLTMAAGAGGNGGSYGGGGGGGGGSTNGFASGKGGDGGPGAIIVTWYG